MPWSQPHKRKEALHYLKNIFHKRCIGISAFLRLDPSPSYQSKITLSIVSNKLDVDILRFVDII